MDYSKLGTKFTAASTLFMDMVITWNQKFYIFKSFHTNPYCFTIICLRTFSYAHLIFVVIKIPLLAKYCLSRNKKS